MRSLAAAFLLIIVLFPGSALHAESASGQLVVGARVAPHVRWQVRDEPALLEITAADIARGFVEVSAARLRVQTNDPAGFIVVAKVSGDEFATGALTGLEQPITIGGGGSGDRGGAALERWCSWTDRIMTGWKGEGPSWS